MKTNEKKPIDLEQSQSSKLHPHSNNAVAVPEFKLDEVIWSKLRGWPHWPARILSFEENKIEIYWFNDYRTSKVFKSALFKFDSSNCEKF